MGPIGEAYAFLRPADHAGFHRFAIRSSIDATPPL
jgi:hypothetical protein